MEINKTKSRPFDKEKLDHIDKAVLLYYIDVQRKKQQKAYCISYILNKLTFEDKIIR